MATITRRSRRNGDDYTYRVQIRRKGYPTLSQSFDTRKDAAQWAREHDRDARLAEAFADARGRNKTLSELIDRYMLEYSGRDFTRLSRLAWWRKNVGDTKLPNVTPDAVADALDDLRAGKAIQSIRGGGKPTQRKRSEATINRYHAALSAVYQHALKKRWGWVKRNPCREVERGPDSRQRDRWLNEDERKRLLEACRKSEWLGLYPLVLLALSTGARKGELLGLRWREVDIPNGHAFLRDAKNSEPRVLPLVKPVREALKEYAKVRHIGSDLLFPSATDPEKPLHFEKYWYPALKQAQVTDFRFHDLRHSCASYLAMNGASAVEIADVLGHKTLQMVKRYSHLATEHKANLLERVTGKMLS
jgi:integrase